MSNFPSFGITPTKVETSGVGLELILELTPAIFDGLTKVLGLLQDNDVISIRDSQIIQAVNNGTTFFTSDISPLIGKNVNLDFTNPKRVISIFKLIKSSTNVKIYDDPEFNRYSLISEESNLTLAKPAQVVENSISMIPTIEELNILGKPITLSGDAKVRAKNFLAKTEKDHVDLLIEQDQLKAVYIPDDIVYHFTDFKNPNLNPTNSELMLKSFSFLKVDGEEYMIHLAKQKINDKFIIVTQIKTNFDKINIDVFEFVDPTTFGNLLI